MSVFSSRQFSFFHLLALSFSRSIFVALSALFAEFLVCCQPFLRFLFLSDFLLWFPSFLVLRFSLSLRLSFSSLFAFISFILVWFFFRSFVPWSFRFWHESWKKTKPTLSMLNVSFQRLHLVYLYILSLFSSLWESLPVSFSSSFLCPFFSHCFLVPLFVFLLALLCFLVPFSNCFPLAFSSSPYLFHSFPCTFYFCLSDYVGFFVCSFLASSDGLFLWRDSLFCDAFSKTSTDFSIFWENHDIFSWISKEFFKQTMLLHEGAMQFHKSAMYVFS